jgi:phosphatidylserine decarboxylase
MNVPAIRPEVLPFLAAAGALFGIPALALWRRNPPWNRWARAGAFLACLSAGYLLYFFRDPERLPPLGDGVVVAAADGVIADIADVNETAHLKGPCVRISIFLSLFDVHVNRAPMAGTATFLGYFPGKRLFTFRAKSSDLNQHNKILIAGKRTRCLVCQIVGPVCRRVVYWPSHERPVPVAVGERIGMMKFGSRLDLYLPRETVTVAARKGDRVRAGETVLARIEPRRNLEAAAHSVETRQGEER